MVSSSQVNGDKDSLSSAKDNYTTAIDSLSESWQGTSYDSLIAKAQSFSNEFFPTINDQLTSFANACDLYEDYKTCKSNIQNAKDKVSYYENAQANLPKDSTTSYSNSITYWKGKVSEYETEKENLKGQIEAALSEASSSTLTATAVAETDYSSEAADTTPEAGSTSGANIGLGNNAPTSSVPANGSVQQSAVDWVTDIAKDDSHGYSGNNNTGNPDYDCSSLIFEAYEKAGIPIKESGANSTKNMKSTLPSVGFEFVSGTPNTSSLQPGDILWKDGHTEMYIGNGQVVGAHLDKDGRPGDSTGKEINIYDYTNKSWSGYFRYTGKM